MFVALLALLPVGIIGIVAVVARRERQRRSDIHAWAAANGWSVSDGDVVAPWKAWLPHLPGFRVRRLLYGRAGDLMVTVADSAYTDSMADGNTSHRPVVVFIANLPGTWPPVTLRRRHAGSRLWQALSGRPAITTGHETFDRQFRVDSPNPAAAMGLLSAELIEAQLTGQAPEWSLTGSDLLIVERMALTAEAIIPGVQRLCWLAALLRNTRPYE